MFFLENLALSVIRYHGQLSSCTISETTNDPILRRLNDGWTDGRTDGRTDGQTNGQTDGQTDGRASNIEIKIGNGLGGPFQLISVDLFGHSWMSNSRFFFFFAGNSYCG